MNQIPESHRDTFEDSIEAAVEAEEPWQQEVPFDPPPASDGGFSVPRYRGGATRSWSSAA